MEIIEIGACLVNIAHFKLIADYQLYIKPVVTPTLTKFCMQLTGIDQATVDAAAPYDKAIMTYTQWLATHEDIAAWASWGNYDKGQFELDNARHGTDNPHADLPHFNLKNLFANLTGGQKMGLGRAIKKVGATFEGRAHSGLDDARNMARLLTLAPKFGSLMKAKINDL